MQTKRTDHCDILWETEEVVGRIGELRSDPGMQVWALQVQSQLCVTKETRRRENPSIPHGIR